MGNDWLNPFANDQMGEERVALIPIFVPGLFNAPGKLLYVGGSKARQEGLKRLAEAKNQITLLEIWPAYAEEMADSPYLEHVVVGDVRLVDQLALPHARYDYVMWWHGPEHIPRYDFKPTVAKLEAITDKVVLLGSPWGYWPWPAEDSNPHQEHQAHLYPRDYESMGYRYVCIWPEDRKGGAHYGLEVDEGCGVLARSEVGEDLRELVQTIIDWRLGKIDSDRVLVQVGADVTRMEYQGHYTQSVPAVVLAWLVAVAKANLYHIERLRPMFGAMESGDWERADSLIWEYILDDEARA